MAHLFQTDHMPLNVGKGMVPRCQAPSERWANRVCGRMSTEDIHRVYPCRKFGCHEKLLSVEQRLIHEDRDHHGNYGV